MSELNNCNEVLLMPDGFFYVCRAQRGLEHSHEAADGAFNYTEPLSDAAVVASDEYDVLWQVGYDSE